MPAPHTSPPLGSLLDHMDHSLLLIALISSGVTQVSPLKLNFGTITPTMRSALRRFFLITAFLMVPSWALLAGVLGCVPSTPHGSAAARSCCFFHFSKCGDKGRVCVNYQLRRFDECPGVMDVIAVQKSGQRVHGGLL